MKIVLALVLLSCAPFAFAASEKVFDIRQYGARGDGKTVNTAAIQKALDQCAHSGGGVVRVPRGRFLTQPLFLHSDITLELTRGARLVATDTREDFLRPGKARESNSSAAFFALINGKDLEHITIRGQGTIDGSGAKWWIPAEAARQKTPGYTLPRPRLILLDGCKNVSVQGVTLLNSPCFHLVPHDCENVRIENVTISAPPGSPNTDGIDPSVSRHVYIAGCHIDVGDDNIAIKSGRKIPGREFACEDIVVTNCVFKHGHGMSIGSETVGGVRRLTVTHCTFEDTENGLRIKSPRGRGGIVSDIVYRDIRMKGMRPAAITITCYYPQIPATDEVQPLTETTPVFGNIVISNLTATATKTAGLIVGLPESNITNLRLENVRISAPTGLIIRNAKAVQMRNANMAVTHGPPMMMQNADVSGE